MGKKMDILTTLSKGIYTDDSYDVVDKQVVSMINEYYRRFKQYTEFQGRMNITILSLDNLDGKEGEDLRWKKIKEALPDVYDKDFVDFTLINCRNMQEIESSFVDHSNFVYNTYEARTIVISRFEIFKDFLKSKEWINQAQFIVWYDTKDEWVKSRLSRPYFGVKSDKIEHKAALSQRWYFLLQENTWRDKNGNKHFVPNMPENYIKNCILWLDETLCGKYIPDPDLRRQFKALFQNELSHRDTLNRISNIMTQNALLNNKKFQDLHSQMAIKCGIESGRWIASEHNYKDLEKDVNKKSAYGTKYWNMSYDELVKQGLWKDAKNNIYIISSMRNGHIANIMDMLNTGKYSLDMSPETKEKYKDLFLDEFRIRNKLKASEIQFLPKEEHNDFHGFDKKENDMIDHPNHYAQTRIECIDAIEACIEPYKDTVDAYLTSNALKYLWRHEFKKNPIEDLKKAIWYINRIIEKYEKGEIKSNK